MALVSNLAADEPSPDGSNERGHWDKRDLMCTMSVIAQALSIDENIRVSNDFTEKDMQEANMMQ